MALFRLVFRGSQWARRRFTIAGVGATTLTLFAGAFGLDTQLNYSYGIFSLGVALLAVDFVASWRMRAELEIKRALPDFLTAGQAGYYTLIIRNRGRRLLQGLSLTERMAQPFPVPSDFYTPLSASQRRRKAWVRYPRWLERVRQLRCVEINPVALPPLPPGALVEVLVPIAALHRGMAVFEAVWVGKLAPLGLCRAACKLAADAVVPLGQSLAILPARTNLDMPPVSQQRHLQPGGISLALRVGDSEEFRSLRDYRPGDPLRSVHWRSWARTGRPVVREYHDEFFSRHALMLDTAAASSFDPAFEAAVSVAATLVLMPRGTDSLLDLLFVGDRVHCVTAGRGLGNTAALLRVLATVKPGPADGFAPLANSVIEGAGQIGSLVCVFLAWDDARLQFVRNIRALGVAPIVFLLLPKTAGLDTVLADPLLAGLRLQALDPLVVLRGGDSR